MSLTLYELKGQWLALAEKLSDMDLDADTIADTIEGSDEQLALEEKVQGYELVARTMEAPRQAIQAEIKRLQTLDKAISARTDALRKRVQDTMTELGIQKIACPLFEVRIQKNPPAVEVFDEQMIPSMFWRTPDPVLDKALLKEHMKAGEEIPGARLIQGESLRVK
ncbi:siphovirus Gp157 family protein [Ottowia sp. GY511]|uniref:Siphovirus Gp157 family protein n=1 Tax=Ottowia flava TaxID=2675430 RepID=A0ABW4KNN8_9BURK|nr:siphovirus Gp157 family protein [Ottowia sp. GY511]TXK27738.1 siphovirus Gp157 family protein [Ottowia sp. GY511]